MWSVAPLGARKVRATQGIMLSNGKVVATLR